VDISELRKIISLVERANIEEIEIEEEGQRIRIRKSGGAVEGSGVAPPAIFQVPGPQPPLVPSWPAQPSSPLVLPDDEKAAKVVEEEETVTINAPMIGTFYRAASPEAPPFISIGDRVEPDTVVCILEAMKTMNEVKAGLGGKVVDILVENAAPVEYGQALFKIVAQ
jgi:acetyl-CoA carboxylase biotin carboxyl carrier protein